jgi:pyruvate dehydrogenase E2 component (dihydrolipoamide acetyltransferase)
MISQVSRRVLSKSIRFSSRIGAPISTRLFSSLPDHLVVGMPALSPTMETGTISQWNVKEGQAFVAGDSLAEIETDKASIDFEAQDDGVVAKILVDASNADIPVGVPIIVTVEEEEDVAAFKDFVVEAPEEPAAAEPEPAPAAVATPAPVVEAAPEPVVAPAPAPVPTPEPVVEAVVEAPVVSSAPTVGPSWGNFARVSSPLAGALSADQKKYVEKYGSTGQVPL